MLSKTTLALFYPYQREVGKYRKKISTLEEFQSYVDKASGYEEAFVSVLPTDGTIDRAHFDLDGKSAIHDGKRLYLWGVTNGFATIPLLTGKKGMQVHILSRPFKVENSKELLSDIESYILNQALGLKSWEDTTSVDWHLFGNVVALCRIPETLRPPENDNYCSFLPPNFTEMSEDEIYRFAKYPYVFPYQITHRKSLLDLPLDIEAEPIKESELLDPVTNPHVHTPFRPTDPISFISNLLSQKRVAEITQQNPPHRARIITTLELLDCGLTADDIVYVYSKLGWHDHNEKISRGYVVDLASRYYRGEYRLRRPE